MKKIAIAAVAVLGAAGNVFAANGAEYGGVPASDGKPRVIFDTDMYTDYDDVGALAMLHALADAGECEIAAVGCNTWGEGNRSVAACEVVNAYYGRGDLTVGCARSGGRQGAGGAGHGLPAKYPQWVRHLVSTNAPLAVDVYREALRKAPDKSVVLCTVGFLNNIADLLRTDSALVERKVRLWVAMACKYPKGKEYNSMHDAAASDFAFSHWPASVPIVWTDYDYGLTCYAGRAVAELPGEGNPVKDAFAARLTPREKVVPGKSWDQLAGHPSWDETAVLIAVRGWEKYFNLERGRHRMVGTDGTNEWVPDAAPNCGRVTEKMPKAEVGRVMDELMCRVPAARGRVETDAERDARLKWFTDARFGMFVHFGAYSLAARHEWVKNYENIPDAEYRKYVDNFDPDLFDAKAWVAAAKDAGMRYIVLTTKHHEGFCLFDSKFTDYKSTRTPFGRDIVREFSDACHEAGIRCGFYYSLLDWHHPDYTMDYWYPGCKGKSKAELAELNRGRDFSKYVDFLHAQVRELLTNYGKIDILWYDFTSQSPTDPWWDTFKHTSDWKGVELMAMTRALQPGIVVNDRLGDGVPADVVTPEQQKTAVWPTHGGRRAPAWETCQTFSGSWGYYRDETTWKSVRQLLVMIVDNVSKGGNTILNVGPTARGEFDARAKERLAGIGRWMHFNGRSVYGCGPAPEGIVAPEGTLLTYNRERNRLYVHLLDYPIGSLPFKFSDRVKYAQFLHDASEIKVKVPLNVSGFPRKDVDPSFILPVVKPDVEIPVIEVLLKD